MLASLLAGGLTAAPPVRAASEQVPVGPRAIALGGAFSAIADDASALFWNPAGLTQLEAQELAGSRAELYGSGIDDSRLAFALPVARTFAAGAEWYNSGFSDNELAFTENRFSLSGAWRANRRISIGLTGKVLTRSYGLDGLDQQRGTGLGADIGALLTPLPGLRMGAVAQDLFDTSIRYDSGQDVLAYPRNVRLGAAYDWRNKLTAAFDLDDRWHAGLEYRPLEMFALEAGLQGDKQNGEGPTWSAGVGASVGILHVEYAYVAPPTLAATHHLGASLVFNFNPPLVRYEKVTVPRELYASMNKTYAEQPRSLGEAIVTTQAQGPINATLSVQIPGVMKSPTQTLVTLRPGAQNVVPLRAILDESVMRLEQDRSVQVDIGLTYTSLRLDRTDHQRAHTTLYRPGAIDWSRGMDQAAAYVTAQDPAIDALGGDIGRQAAHLPLGPLAKFPQETQLIAVAMDALATIGIDYLPDPVNTYASVSERRGAVDTIYYPVETLARHVGDCDDSTILTAALLTNLGVETCFIDAPGHIFLLADAGLTDSDARQLTLPEGRFVPFDGRLWIPLETTSIKRGFASVWADGAQQWGALAAHDDSVLVPLSEARAKYPASLPERPAGAVPTAVVADSLARHMGTSVAEIGSWQDARIAELSAQLAPPRPTAAAVAEVARLDLAGGSSARAAEGLRAALALEPTNARLEADLGAALAGDGDLTAAAASYASALRHDAGDFVTWWNAAIVYDAAGDSATATRLAAEALRRAGGTAGLAAAVPTPTASQGDVTARAIARLLARGSSPRGGAAPLDASRVPDLRAAETSRRPRPELLPWLTWRKP